MPEAEGTRCVFEIVFGDAPGVGDALTCLAIGFSEVNGAWRTGLTDALSVTTFAPAGA